VVQKVFDRSCPATHNANPATYALLALVLVSQ
jgi:hypothetical protein